MFLSKTFNAIAAVVETTAAINPLFRNSITAVPEQKKIKNAVLESQAYMNAFGALDFLKFLRYPDHGDGLYTADEKFIIPLPFPS